MGTTQKLSVRSGANFDLPIDDYINYKPLKIDNEFFEGILIIRFSNWIWGKEHQNTTGKDKKEVAEDPEDLIKSRKYFDNRSRKFSFQVQGKFKQEINGDDLIWDISFPYGLQNLPFFTPMAVKFLHYLDPATAVDFYAPEAFVKCPVLTMMNAMSCWDASEGYDRCYVEGIEEDGKYFGEQTWDAPKRRKFYLDTENRKSFTFSTDKIYAFESFNPHMDWSGFTAKIPGFEIKVSKYLGTGSEGQKNVRVRMISRDGEKTFAGFDLTLTEEKN